MLPGCGPQTIDQPLAPIEQPHPDLTDVSVEQIIEVLSDSSDELDFERRAAALLAGLQRDPRLLTLVESRTVSAVDPRVRELCAAALGNYGEYSSIEALRHAVADVDPGVRAAALRSLGLINDPETAPLIASGLDDPEPQVRAAALEALARFGPQIHVPALAGRQADLDFLRDRPNAACLERGRSIYVDATTGKDSNLGTKAAPLRTLAAATALLEPQQGMTIYATAGEKQTPFNESVLIGPTGRGDRGCPTRLSAWPGKPAPLIQAAQFYPLPQLHRVESDRGARYELPLAKRPLRILAQGLDAQSEIRLTDESSEDESAAWYTGSSLMIRGEVGDGVWVSTIEDGIRVDRAPYVEVSGFTVRMAADSGIDFDRSPNGVCRECTVKQAGRHGIFFYYAPMGTVIDSQVSDCGFQGISVRSSPDTLISNSRSSGNGVDGVLFLYDSDRGTLYGSTIVDNRIRGVGADQGSNGIRVIDCVLAPNIGPELRSDDSSSIQVIP
ncbi:MAG: HEAT repeat domain-containing protein [Candidatus Alcyoniella australis]|nr:HEAT repeat domain-containing protein [Candidatus Alcyoniella australis]